MRSVFLVLLGVSSFASGAIVQTQVNLQSTSTLLKDHLGAALTPGTALDGDGAVIQLGYYTGATAGNNFAGTWVALTGNGGNNTGGDTGSGLHFNTTSIGDIGGGGAPGGSGIFTFSIVFDSSVAGTFNSLPSSTAIPLAIKIFDGTSVGASNYFNVVSDNAWVWKTPATPNPQPPTITMNLDGDPNLIWQSIAVAGQSGTTAFTTSIALVPEPSIFTFSALATLALAGVRRRRK